MILPLLILTSWDLAQSCFLLVEVVSIVHFWEALPILMSCIVCLLRRPVLWGGLRHYRLAPHVWCQCVNHLYHLSIKHVCSMVGRSKNTHNFPTLSDLTQPPHNDALCSSRRINLIHSERSFHFRSVPVVTIYFQLISMKLNLSLTTVKSTVLKFVFVIKWIQVTACIPHPCPLCPLTLN